jgi:hypothetical protein
MIPCDLGPTISHIMAELLDIVYVRLDCADSSLCCLVLDFLILYVVSCTAERLAILQMKLHVTMLWNIKPTAHHFGKTAMLISAHT